MLVELELEPGQNYARNCGKICMYHKKSISSVFVGKRGVQTDPLSLLLVISFIFYAKS